MNCTKCGMAIPDDVPACPYCGAVIEKALPENEGSRLPKSSESEKTQNMRSASEPKLYINAYQAPVNTPSSPFPVEKNNRIWKILAVLGGAVLIVILALFVVRPIIINNSLQKTYNTGASMLENGEYADALSVFLELGDFKDAGNMARRAQMEIDYQNIDSLLETADYRNAARILRERSEFYVGTEEGEKASKLADKYELLADAYQAKADGDYEKALSKFNILELMTDEYSAEICICKARIAEKEYNWTEVLLNLYALQIGDTHFSFLDNPKNDSDRAARDAFWNNDKYALIGIIHVDGAEPEELLKSAKTGAAYDEGNACLEAGDYIKAMELFESLGEYRDSKLLYDSAAKKYEACAVQYTQAEEYFQNGEYYKAEKLFNEISKYEDAAERAASCKRSLPENGSFKKGNGSGIPLTIEAPSGDESVYLKIYDASGSTAGKVFLRPGKSATLYMKSGTYTIKIAYGTDWYGEIDVFGESGSYSQLMNGSSRYFEFYSNYYYTLQLQAGSDGNVGSQRISGAGAM